MKALSPIFALLIGAAISADASGLPEEVPLSRYQAMVERSPFAPATAATPPPAPVVETPSFAKDFYVTGMARLGGQSFVTITSRDKQQRFSLVVGESYQGITLASVDWANEVGKGKATLKKGSEFGVIGFDEAAMQLVPVAAATAAPSQPPGTGQPNSNNPYAAFEGRRRGPDGGGGPGRGWGGWDRRNPNGGGGQGGQGEWRRRNRPIPNAPQ